MKRQLLNRQPYVYRSYASFRRPEVVSQKRRRALHKSAFVLVLLVLLAGSGAYALAHFYKKPAPGSTNSTSVSSNTSQSSSTRTTTKTKPKTNYCADNTLSQLVLVSITKQHLWACDGSTTAYDSPVVTGMELYPADLTPPGTYHIYAKETDQDLKGCDSTGCWNDPVSYWMPWLSNEYGIYGFHDATWRKPSQFGHVDIYAPETAAVVGSHGCVELPLATAKWMYDWSHVGTTVKIVS